MTISHVDLPDNDRPAKPGVARIGTADPNELVPITIIVRGKQPVPEPAPEAPRSVDEIEAISGADPNDMALVAETLKKYGLTVDELNAGARSIECVGPVSTVNAVFDVDLGRYRFGDREYRGREGKVRIPEELAGVVLAVLGLDDRQVAKRRPVLVRDEAALTQSGVGPQVPSDLETRYSFPPGEAAGQTIGILEFGGGYFESDLALYCGQIGRTQPQVTTIAVGLKSLTLQEIQAMSQQNQQNEMDESGEVNMDIQIVAGLCPQANISVYFAPFTQKGWVNILTKAIHGANAPKVISVSWGAAEDSGNFSSAAITAINTLLQTAAAAGVTICVSSGDDGAGDAVNDGQAHCDFPGSSPYVLAVGGTMFPGGAPESGWWDTPGARTNNGGGSSGGGRSTVFGTPAWQNVPVISVRTGQASGRCMPDVSALSGEPFYSLVFDGQSSPNGGTSASAPLWASLLARINGNGKQVGFLTAKLYQPGPNGAPLGQSVTQDISSGQNTVLANPAEQLVAVAGYQAGPGYDAVTGWGVPIGTALQNAL